MFFFLGINAVPGAHPSVRAQPGRWELGTRHLSSLCSGFVEMLPCCCLSSCHRNVPAQAGDPVKLQELRSHRAGAPSVPLTESQNHQDGKALEQCRIPDSCLAPGLQQRSPHSCQEQGFKSCKPVLSGLCQSWGCCCAAAAWPGVCGCLPWAQGHLLPSSRAGKSFFLHRKRCQELVSLFSCFPLQAAEGTKLLDL